MMRSWARITRSSPARCRALLIDPTKSIMLSRRAGSLAGRERGFNSNAAGALQRLRARLASAGATFRLSCAGARRPLVMGPPAAIPRISIVTPSFNRRRFLAAAMDSVVDQRYADLEYVVVDGASTDGSAALISSYGARL